MHASDLTLNQVQSHNPLNHVEDPELDFPPDYRNYLIYVDESGIHSGSRYYGWGSLWIPAERRGDLSEILSVAKLKHRFQGEVKWSKLGDRSVDFACELIDEVLKRNWMMFHALLMPRSEIKVELFKGGLMEARLHHLSTFLRSKIEFFGRGHLDKPPKTYHIRVDPLPSVYAMEHEKISNITNAMLQQTVGSPKITSMHVVNSRHRAGVQVADLLLGAALARWQVDHRGGSAKDRVCGHLLSRIGWHDHVAGTYAHEWKFNLWWLASAGEPRHAPGRRCNFHFPVRPYRRK